MKRCPTCNRTYTDPNLSFCIDDGTPLTAVADDETTVVSPSATETRDDWNAAPYRPPSSYVPPPPAKQRRVWPWLLGIGGAFVLGIVALMIVGAIFVPRMMREREVRVPVSAPVNTEQQPETTDNVNAPPPTDEEQVLAQLTALEHEWTAANLNADKQKLGRILADDYVDRAGERGALQGKKQYLDTVRRETRVERWEFDDLKVHLAGDRATLTGKIKYVQRDREDEFDFVDKFVWRDGRWQATGSEVKRRE